ncbi:unnamed protein product [Paramecium octaurelia]|uniref:Uncharacterized protein n=1 Tax=Paramecium octaurelia TaxID=43137 RepID=A0A8S1TSI7_PAROT|nr:unnamed protein product [Paramecium octaurelia]
MEVKILSPQLGMHLYNFLFNQYPGVLHSQQVPTKQDVHYSQQVRLHESQPSQLSKLPSSHPSQYVTILSPQIGAHSPLLLNNQNPDLHLVQTPQIHKSQKLSHEKTQLMQPSKGSLFPSSHCSVPPTIQSPQKVTHLKNYHNHNIFHRCNLYIEVNIKINNYNIHHKESDYYPHIILNQQQNYFHMQENIFSQSFKVYNQKNKQNIIH